MILADTSIWVHHFRTRLPRMNAALGEGKVVMHPMVIGELACGNMLDRSRVLHEFAQLPSTEIATHAEVLELIERRKLHGKGIGYIDANLLASTLISPRTLLWTADKRLAEIAAKLGVAFRE